MQGKGLLGCAHSKRQIVTWLQPLLHHEMLQGPKIVQCGKTEGARPFQGEQSQEQGFVHKINELLAGENFGRARDRSNHLVLVS